MFEVLSVPCLLCDSLLDFNNGKFESHMKKYHSMTTNNVSFFVAIHFLKAREREKIKTKMRERIEAESWEADIIDERITLDKSDNTVKLEKETDIEITNNLNMGDIMHNEREERDISGYFNNVNFSSGLSVRTFDILLFKNKPPTITEKATDFYIINGAEPRITIKNHERGALNDLQTSYKGAKIA